MDYRSHTMRGRLYDPEVVAAQLRGEKGEREMTTRMSQADKVGRVERALRQIGRPAGLGTIVRQIGISQTSVSDYIVAAMDANVVDRIGTKGSKAATYTLRSWQNGHAPEPEKGESIKEAILVLAGEHPGMDINELAKALAHRDQRWATMGGHSILHVVFQMRKQGLIEFILQRSGGGQQRATNIRLVATRSSEVGRVVRSTIEAMDEGVPSGPIERDGVSQGRVSFAPSDAAPEPEARPETVVPEPAEVETRWPVLEALRQRVLARAEDQKRATAWMEAAAILESTDPETARMLEGKANVLATSISLSSVEAEYLAFAEEKC